ncbi:hypothetical protein FGO68_gene6996 [Halteria grandinella]|uniref:Uncharacterized protein n=1 Tax=Halteria grandinella TaxID=5974 RepID=A0A8J8NVA4_HALGN|nr:hypothetical protein FGO68_gene6996 [Halteria grandinella]
MQKERLRSSHQVDHTPTPRLQLIDGSSDTFQAHLKEREEIGLYKKRQPRIRVEESYSTLPQSLERNQIEGEDKPKSSNFFVNHPRRSAVSHQASVLSLETASIAPTDDESISLPIGLPKFIGGHLLTPPTESQKNELQEYVKQKTYQRQHLMRHIGILPESPHEKQTQAIEALNQKLIQHRNSFQLTDNLKVRSIQEHLKPPSQIRLSVNSLKLQEDSQSQNSRVSINITLEERNKLAYQKHVARATSNQLHTVREESKSAKKAPPTQEQELESEVNQKLHQLLDFIAQSDRKNSTLPNFKVIKCQNPISEVNHKTSTGSLNRGVTLSKYQLNQISLAKQNKMLQTMQQNERLFPKQQPLGHSSQLTSLEAERIRRRLQDPELVVKAVSKYFNHVLLLGSDAYIAKKHLAYRKQFQKSIGEGQVFQRLAQSTARSSQKQ